MVAAVSGQRSTCAYACLGVDEPLCGDAGEASGLQLRCSLGNVSEPASGTIFRYGPNDTRRAQLRGFQNASLEHFIQCCTVGMCQLPATDRHDSLA